ncbi:MAG: hypothetical protein ACREGG_02225 [Candidatus Saccharimonadales bacterium]
MSSNERYTQPEEVIELHPLDEIGRDINILLGQESHLTETLAGQSFSRNIQHGDVSFFFSRIDSPQNRKFTVGIDLVHNEELIAVCNYQWDIYNPSGSDLTERDFKKLRTMLNVASMVGQLDGEA